MEPTAADMPKKEWILQNLVCTTCTARAPLSRTSDALECPACHEAYEANSRHVNMLPAALREKFNITSTDKVSDHPYDERAKDIIADVATGGGMVLDCGCGSRTARYDNLVQLEIVDYDNVDVLGVNQALPFKDETFHAVLSFDVLEHVDDPFLAAREIIRVLKPGGTLYVDVPFMQNEHGYPEHYYNMTRMGLKRLFKGGLDVEEHWIPKSGHPIYTLYFVIMAYYGGLPKKRRPDFEAMTMGEFIRSHPKQFYDQPLFAEFDPERAWLIASTTRAIFRKPATPAPVTTDAAAPQEA